MTSFEDSPPAATCMTPPSQTGSQVARLLLSIQRDYAAAQQGLYGLAQGTARHQCIDATLRRVQQAHEQLASLVGAAHARTLLAHAVWTADELEGHAAPCDVSLPAPPSLSRGGPSPQQEGPPTRT